MRRLTTRASRRDSLGMSADGGNKTNAGVEMLQ